MRINNNMMAMNTHRQLGIANAGGAKSMEKLSSGFRINRAGDDAAGLAISEKMRGQIRGLNMASKNAQDGISLIQTTEGALNETHAILQRMRELAVQSSTDTNTDTDRTNIQDEINQLSEEITRIATTTEFNTMKLLDGSFEGKKFHIGANEGQDITFEVKDMSSKGLKLDSKELTEVYETGDINGSNIKIYGNDGKEIEIEFVNSGAGTTPPAIASGADGKLTVSYQTSGMTLDTLKTALSGKGVTVAVVDGKTDIDLSKLDGQTIKAGKFNQANVSVGGLDATIKNGDVTSIDIVTGDTHNATTSAKFENGKLTINMGSNLSGTSGAALQTALQTLITAKVSGVILGDIASGIAGTDLTTASVDSIKLEAKVEGDSALVEGDSIGRLDVSNQKNASRAITTINDALENVSKERSKLGSIQNRLEHTIKNLDTSSENLQASESRIRDVDMAKEMMEQTKNNILQQASTAMLAQANQAPQTVLSLLR